MRKRSILAMSLFALLLVVVLGVFVYDELRYEGKSVGDWLRILGDPKAIESDKASARNAFDALGPDSVPYIFKEVQKVDGRFQKYYLKIWTKITRFKVVLYLPRPLQGADKQEIVFGASEALPRLKPSAIPLIAEFLDHSSVHTREVSIRALRDFQSGGHKIISDETDAELIQRLIECLDDSEPDIRKYALEILGSLGSQAQPAVPSIIDLLSDFPLVLKQVSPTPPTVAMSFRKPLPPEQSIHKLAVEALYKIGDPSGTVLNRLNQIARTSNFEIDPNITVVAAATLGIWKLSGETSYPVQRLIELWIYFKPYQKLAVLEAFAEMGPTAVDAVPFLMELLEQGEQFFSVNMRFKAEKALRAIDPENALINSSQRNVLPPQVK